MAGLYHHAHFRTWAFALLCFYNEELPSFSKAGKVIGGLCLWLWLPRKLTCGLSLRTTVSFSFPIFPTSSLPLTSKTSLSELKETLPASYPGHCLDIVRYQPHPSWLASSYSPGEGRKFSACPIIALGSEGDISYSPELLGDNWRAVVWPRRVFHLLKPVEFLVSLAQINQISQNICWKYNESLTFSLASWAEGKLYDERHWMEATSFPWLKQDNGKQGGAVDGRGPEGKG